MSEMCEGEEMEGALQLAAFAHKDVLQASDKCAVSCCGRASMASGISRCGSSRSVIGSGRDSSTAKSDASEELEGDDGEMQLFTCVACEKQDCSGNLPTCPGDHYMHRQCWLGNRAYMRDISGGQQRIMKHNHNMKHDPAAWRNRVMPIHCGHNGSVCSQPSPEGDSSGNVGGYSDT